MIAQAVFCASMAGAKVCTPLITPHRLTSSTRRQRSMWSHGPPPGAVPALFISTATSPKVEYTLFFSACTLSRRLTSVGTISTPGEPTVEAAVTSASARIRASADRSARQTLRPKVAK
jgi:hypothetical protein